MKTHSARPKLVKTTGKTQLEESGRLSKAGYRRATNVRETGSDSALNAHGEVASLTKVNRGTYSTILGSSCAIV